MVMQVGVLYQGKLPQYIFFFPTHLHKCIHHVIDCLFLLYNLNVRDLGSLYSFFFFFFLN